MSERVERIIFFVLIGFAVLSIAWFRASWEKLQEDKKQMEFYETQIERLETESKIQKERFDEARKRAKTQMRQVENEALKMLAKNVSKDPAKAIAWGLDEAQNF